VVIASTRQFYPRERTPVLIAQDGGWAWGYLKTEQQN